LIFRKSKSPEEKGAGQAPDVAQKPAPEPKTPEKSQPQTPLEADDALLAELAQLVSSPKTEPGKTTDEKPEKQSAQPPSEVQSEPAQEESLTITAATQEKVAEKTETPKEQSSENALESDDEMLAELAQVMPTKEKAPSQPPVEKMETSAEAQPEPPQDESLRNISETDDTVLDELGEKLSINERIGAPKEFSGYCTFDLPPGYQELERYWITKPLVWVAILYSPDQNERMYYLVEPSLTPGEKTSLQILHEHLLDRLVYDERIKDRDRVLQMKTNELLREYGIALQTKSIKKLLYYLKRNYMGYGKLDGIFKDPNIEDISCDGLNVPIFIYSRRYQSLRTNLVFTDTNELDLYTIRLVEKAGKQISLGKPSVDASLPEGYRLQATLGTEVTTRGSSFSIRKYAEEPFTPVDVLSYGTFSVEMLAYLWLGTENKKNVIIVGGTASGKTSTLNALSMFIWPDAKIVSIEDTRELALYQSNWIPSVVKLGAGDRSIDMYDLLRTALRQRPEVIIVGEVRGKEALTMFQAMSTGHTCYSTMHAGSIQEMVHRLEGEPINVPHHMLAAMDIVCLQLLTYYRDQRVRRNQSIVEISGIDPSTSSLRTNRIFERNPLTDEFERVGESNVLREIAKERGWSAIELERELRRRQEVLGFLLKNNIRRMHEVAAVFRQYYFEPEKVMEQLAAGKLKI
jgi:flagellar protein FlaI